MSRSNSRGDNWLRTPTVAWAGWLFADMLLVLFLVGLGSQSTVFPATAEDSLTPSTSPSPPQPTPSITPTPMEPPGLNRDPVIISLDINTSALLDVGPMQEEAAEALRVQVVQGLNDEGAADATAGMVLIWGYASQPGRGMTIAEAVATQLPAASDVFEVTPGRALWSGGAESRVDLEIYLLNR